MVDVDAVYIRYCLSFVFNWADRLRGLAWQDLTSDKRGSRVDGRSFTFLMRCQNNECNFSSAIDYVICAWSSKVLENHPWEPLISHYGIIVWSGSKPSHFPWWTPSWWWTITPTLTTTIHNRYHLSSIRNCYHFGSFQKRQLQRWWRPLQYFHNNWSIPLCGVVFCL